MSLAAINSQYNGLNGLSGMGAYGGWGGTTSLYSNTYVDNAKQNIANAYDISATSNSYANKGSVSSSSFAQQCQAIEYLLQQGRTDDAMDKYETLYNDMEANSNYQGYSENEIKTLLQSKYMEATGTTLINDITNHSSSSFASGVESSIPIFGLLLNGNSADDFVAQATGTNKSNISKVKTGLGVATTVAASGALAASGVAVKNTIKAVKGGTGVFDALKTAFSKSSNKNAKIVAAAIAGTAALATFIGNKIFKSANQ